MKGKEMLLLTLVMWRQSDSRFKMLAMVDGVQRRRWVKNSPKSSGQKVRASAAAAYSTRLPCCRSRVHSQRSSPGTNNNLSPLAVIVLRRTDMFMTLTNERYRDNLTKNEKYLKPIASNCKSHSVMCKIIVLTVCNTHKF